VGAGSTYAVNATGGAKEVTLTLDEIPAHEHEGFTNETGDHNHNGTTSPNGGAHSHDVTWEYSTNIGTNSNPPGGGSSSGFNSTLSTTTSGQHIHSFTTQSNGDHSHSFTTLSTGGGQAHENRPPYYALAYIMKL